MTSDDKDTGKTGMNDTTKSLGSHREPERLEAHPEAERLEAHKPDDDTIVPAVTADIDETPGFIKYGAAVLLGLAFGVGCYVWVDGGIPSYDKGPSHSAVRIAPTEAYFTQAGTYDDPSLSGVIPDPFVSPFEPTFEQTPTAEYTASDAPYMSDANDVSTSAKDAKQLGEAPQIHEIIAVASTASPVIYLFEYASAEVPETAELTAIAEQAKKQSLTLDVRAYTDESGRPAYNQRLSERRAKAIGDYLIAHGVPASKISVKGMGPTHAFGNDAQDRRAEITVTE